MLENKLKEYANQIPSELTLAEFCNKMEYLIDTDYINDKIDKMEKVNLKLIPWKNYYKC